MNVKAMKRKMIVVSELKEGCSSAKIYVLYLGVR